MPFAVGREGTHRNGGVDKPGKCSIVSTMWKHREPVHSEKAVETMTGSGTVLWYKTLYNMCSTAWFAVCARACVRATYRPTSETHLRQ